MARRITSSRIQRAWIDDVDDVLGEKAARDPVDHHVRDWIKTRVTSAIGEHGHNHASAGRLWRATAREEVDAADEQEQSDDGDGHEGVARSSSRKGGSGRRRCDDCRGRSRRWRNRRGRRDDGERDWLRAEAEAIDERNSFRIRRRVELLTESPREAFEEREGAAAIAACVERDDSASHPRFVEGRELRCANRVLCSGGELARRLLLPAEMLEGAQHSLERLRALLHEPRLELFADAADVHAFEQLAAVERDRLVVVCGGECVAERGDVAPELRAVDHELVVSARNEHVFAEREAQLVERVSERAARGEGVELRPEHREERVTPMEAIGPTRHVGE